MTQLSDAVLADLCRRAGFGRPELYTAIAAAVATSGGRPGYEHAIYPGPVAVYKGLWGVDLCEWPDYIGVDLADPSRAAEAAYDLTVECGGLDWCPAVRSGAFRPYLDRALRASSMMPGAEPVPAPIVQYAQACALESDCDRSAVLHNAIGDHATRRR